MERIECPTREIRYGVLLNDLSLDTGPINFSGWRLERATGAELSEFLERLTYYASASITWGRPPHEFRVVDLGEGRQEAIHIDDPAQWRYSVVRPLNSENAISQTALKQALRLSEADLYVETWSVRDMIGGSFHGMLTEGHASAWAYFAGPGARFSQPAAVDDAELRQTAATRSALEASRYPRLERSLDLFMQLDAVGEAVDAKTLGYFTVLETPRRSGDGPRLPDGRERGG